MDTKGEFQIMLYSVFFLWPEEDLLFLATGMQESARAV